MLCLSHTPLALTLVALFLISTQFKFTLFPDLFNVVSAIPCTSHPVVQRFQHLSFSPLRTSQELASYHIPPPWDVLHESRYPHMCRYADPVSMSRIGRLPLFNRCSLARRGVDYICMVQCRASQLTHGINGEGRKWDLGGEEREK